MMKRFKVTGGANGGRLEEIVSADGDRPCHLAGEAVWIDLPSPGPLEIGAVEAQLSISIPSREEMREIEISSRLFQEGQAHFMTTPIIYRVDAAEPLKGEIMFILTRGTLVTVRHDSPRAFELFAHKAKTGDIACRTPAEIAVGLLDAIVEREADLIERLQAESETLSQRVFEMKGGEATRNLRHAVALKEIGHASVVLSRTREALVSQGRLLSYFLNAVRDSRDQKGVQQRIKATLADVRALSAHVDYISERLGFLMDATIGLVGIEQNQIIKLFSVVAVMLMPPTLIASIYGMNFEHMPELAWPWAYPVTLVAMVVSAVLPFLYFKRKGWL